MEKKRGRPKKEGNKSVVHCVRLTEDTTNKLESLIYDLGMTKSDVLEYCISTVYLERKEGYFL